MQHFQVELTSLGALVGLYPHSPEDQIQSQMDYLEDKLSQGFEFVSRDGSASSWYYTFRVIGK